MRRRRVLKALPGALAGLAGCSEGTTRTEPSERRTTGTRSSRTEGGTDTTEGSTTPKQIPLPWTQLPGPPGGPVSGIAVSPANPKYIYAVCMTGGPYASTDGGQSWLQSQAAFHHGTGMVANPHDPNVARNGVARRTTTAGKRWYAGNASHEQLRGIQFNGGVTDIAYDHKKPKVLYAGTTEGFYRTFDAGLNWEQVPLGIQTDSNRINRITAHREREGVVATVLPDNRVAVSTDYGDSWSVIQGTETIPSRGWSRGVVFDHTTDLSGYVHAGTGVYRFGEGSVVEVTADVDPLRLLWYGDIHLSSDANRLYFVAKPVRADSWTETHLYVYEANSAPVRPLDHPDYAASATTHPTDPDTVYLGGGSWVYESTDAGASWTALSNDFHDRYLAAGGVNPDKPGTVISGSICSSGLWTSQDHGKTYDWKRAGLKPFLGATGDRHYEEHYIMRIDGGGSYMYATTAAGLLVSENNGANWRLSTNVPDYETHGLDHYHGLGADPTDPTRVFMGTGIGRHAETNQERDYTPTVERTSRIWRSTDGAQNWTEVTDGFPSRERTVVQDILVSRDDPAVVYAGTNRKEHLAVAQGPHAGTGLGVFRSRNGGSQWQRLDTPFQNIHALAQDAGNPNQVYASGPRGIFRTKDAGNTWERVFRSPSKALLAHPEVGGLLFAGARKYDGYWDAFVSTDGGDTWAEANLTIQIGRSPSGREYDGLDYNADYAHGGGGDFMQFSLNPKAGHLVVATAGAGLWRCDVNSLVN